MERKYIMATGSYLGAFANTIAESLSEGDRHSGGKTPIVGQKKGPGK